MANSWGWYVHMPGQWAKTTVKSLRSIKGLAWRTRWSRGSRQVVFVLVIDQDAIGGAFGIVELAIAQRPEKGRQPRQSQPQGNGYQEQQAVHLTARARRSELAMTTSELADIAAAAINGVSIPASARGTASTL